jgi:hypothetical protein
MFTPEIVIGPELKEPAGPMLLTTLPVVEIVIVLRFELRPIPVPATSDTLLDVPFKEKLVAAGADATPMICILLAPVESVMFAPAEITIVPVLETKPFAETAFSPEIETVIAPAAVAVCKLMFGPAAKAKEIAVPVTLVPDALIVCVPSACTLAEIVIVLPAWPIPIPAPAEIDTCPLEPFND